MKKKIDAAKKILRKYRKYKFRKNLTSKLKLLVKRKNIWRKFNQTQVITFLNQAFGRIK